MIVTWTQPCGAKMQNFYEKVQQRTNITWAMFSLGQGMPLSGPQTRCAYNTSADTVMLSNLRGCGRLSLEEALHALPAGRLQLHAHIL